MKPKPKPPEVYVARSRFGKGRGAGMCAHVFGRPSPVEGLPDVDPARCRICGDLLPVEAEPAGAILELKPSTETAGAHVVIRRPLKVKLGDLVSLEQLKP